MQRVGFRSQCDQRVVIGLRDLVECIKALPEDIALGPGKSTQFADPIHQEEDMGTCLLLNALILGKNGRSADRTRQVLDTVFYDNATDCSWHALLS
jgi:hypothetical protein